eukprot:CAMPEP_0118841004 /NCGR_PEP_ID=MMETSP1162-20130426/74816_1 /TAXON_ID=33656 /ORGANISM="Phaeocystis Sp, Strain CCMP2710" /LENGTH=48 /DNA_ID= /DNA_START= /DNA_END= /DNA_ORIENTATION=
MMINIMPTEMTLAVLLYDGSSNVWYIAFLHESGGGGCLFRRFCSGLEG